MHSIMGQKFVAQLKDCGGWGNSLQNAILLGSRTNLRLENQLSKTYITVYTQIRERKREEKPLTSVRGRQRTTSRKRDIQSDSQSCRSGLKKKEVSYV